MRASLVEVLADAQQRGLLGPDPIERYVAHAHGYLPFLAAHPGEGTNRGVDLGSGGGVPGLVLALERPDTSWTLVERSPDRDLVLVDGVKAFHGDGWVLALPDPEEPITHIWAEGSSDRVASDLAQEYVRRIGQLVRP